MKEHKKKIGISIGLLTVAMSALATSDSRIAHPNPTDEDKACDIFSEGEFFVGCGLGYGNYQWAIDLLEMRPTRPTLRFKDVTLLRSE